MPSLPIRTTNLRGLIQRIHGPKRNTNTAGLRPASGDHAPWGRRPCFLCLLRSPAAAGFVGVAGTPFAQTLAVSLKRVKRVCATIDRAFGNDGRRAPPSRWKHRQNQFTSYEVINTSCGDTCPPKLDKEGPWKRVRVAGGRGARRRIHSHRLSIPGDKGGVRDEENTTA